jgi:hypothetical protein
MPTDLRERPVAADAPNPNVPDGEANTGKGINHFIGEFWTLQNQLARDSGGVNHDIYEKRLSDPANWPNFQMTPHSMFFYYVRINSDGRLVVDHYFYVDGDEADLKTWKQIPYDKEVLRAIVKKLALNARPLKRGETRVLEPIARGDFNKTKWNRKSYIAIFFDEANWSLRKRADGNSGVTFVVDDGVNRRTPNHSFFDAMDLAVEMPIRRPQAGGDTTDTRSAIVFVNHMKGDESGRDLERGEKQQFKFSMMLDVKAAMADDPPTVFIIDPGGENGGPSVPPPPT